MVNGFRYYRAVESVSIASALSTALTIYPCQIRVHQRWRSKLQLPTARKKEWRPATANGSPQAVTCQHCDTHYFSMPRTRNLPIVGWLLVRRATSSATGTDSPHRPCLQDVKQLRYISACTACTLPCLWIINGPDCRTNQAVKHTFTDSIIVNKWQVRGKLRNTIQKWSPVYEWFITSRQASRWRWRNNKAIVAWVHSGW